MKNPKIFYCLLSMLIFTTGTIFSQNADQIHQAGNKLKVKSLKELIDSSSNGIAKININDLLPLTTISYVDLSYNIYVNFFYEAENVNRPTLQEKVSVPITLTVHGSIADFIDMETLVVKPDKNLSVLAHSFSRSSSEATKRFSKIDSVSIDFPISAVSYLDTATQSLIKVELYVEYYRYELDKPNQLAPAMVVSSGNVANPQDGLMGNELMVIWDKMPEPTSYELEWVHVSDNTIPFDFKKKSIRIQTDRNFYPLSLLFSPGYLFFRVRTVRPVLSADSTSISNERRYGPWSDTVSYMVSGTDSFLSGPNWQYNVSYYNNGKKKEIMHFFDGSRRKRQTVRVQMDFDEKTLVPGATELPSSITIMAQENYYDYEGKPVIEVMPSPVSDANYIGYQQQLNTFNGNKLKKLEYDSLDFAYQLDSTTKGASRYYSSENLLLDSIGFPEAKWIPSAEGFPYSKVEYMPDGSGRVKTVYSPGAETIDSASLNTSYYYAKPLPSELDKLFGTNVGYASFYKKDVIVDPNGQMSIAYKDIQNRVIATSIARDTNVISEVYPISSAPSHYKVFSDNIIASGANKFIESENGFEMIYPFFVPVSSEYNFEYSFDVESFTACAQICYDCRYLFELQVLNGNNEIVLKLEDSLSFDSTCTRAEFMMDENVFENPLTSPIEAAISNDTLSVQLLGPGKYTLIKRLNLLQNELEIDAENYVENNQCGLKTESYFISKELDSTNFSECYSDFGTEDPCWEIRSQIEEDLTWPNGILVQGALESTPILPFIYYKLHNTYGIGDCFSIQNLQDSAVSLTALVDSFNTYYGLEESPTMSEFENRFLEFLSTLHPNYCQLEKCRQLNNQQSLQFDKMLELSESVNEFSQYMSTTSFGSSTTISNPTDSTIIADKDGILYLGDTALWAFDSTFASLGSLGKLVSYVTYWDSVQNKDISVGISDIAYKISGDINEKWNRYKSLYRQIKSELYSDLIFNTICISENYDRGKCGPGSTIGNSLNENALPITFEDSVLTLGSYGSFDLRVIPLDEQVPTSDPPITFFQLLQYIKCQRCNEISFNHVFSFEKKDYSDQLDSLVNIDTSKVDSIKSATIESALENVYNLIVADTGAYCSLVVAKNIFISSLSDSAVFDKFLCSPYYTMDSLNLVDGCYNVNIASITTPFLKYVKDENGDPLYSCGQELKNSYNCYDFTQKAIEFEQHFGSSAMPYFGSSNTVDIANAKQQTFKNWMNKELGLNLSFMDYYQMSKSCTFNAGISVFDELVNRNEVAYIDSVQRALIKVNGLNGVYLDSMSNQELITTLNNEIDKENSDTDGSNTGNDESAFDINPNLDYLEFGVADVFGNEHDLYYLKKKNERFRFFLDTISDVFQAIRTKLHVLPDYEESFNSSSHRVEVSQYSGISGITNLLIDRVQRSADGTVWVRLLNASDSSYYNDLYYHYDPYNYLYRLNDVLSIDSIQPVFDKEEIHYVQVDINNSPLKLLVQSAKPLATAHRFPDVVLGNSTAGSEFPLAKNCEQLKYEKAKITGRMLYQQYIDTVKESFKNRYVNFCLNKSTSKALSNEKLNVQYTAPEYHYTLYYYDQAGNLVQTVPPEGVDTSFKLTPQVKTAIENYRTGASTDNLTPDHTMLSQYKYNSANQLIRQTTPNSGTSYFWYDRGGRLVLSQNAKQAPSDFSYTLYDSQNRIVETGETEILWFSGIAYDAISGSILADSVGSSGLDFKSYVESLEREHVTKIFYDREVSGLSIPGFDQENLRSRVSTQAIYRFFGQGSTDLDWQYAVHYSYDGFGNVKTIVNDYYQAGKIINSDHRFKRLDYYFDPVSNNVIRVYYQLGKEDAFIHEYSYDAEGRISGVRTSRDGIIWDNDANYKYYLHGPLARMELGEQKVQGIDYAYTLNGWMKTVNSAHKDADMGNDNSSSSVFAEDAFGFSLHYNQNDYRPIGNIPPGNNPKISYNGNSELYNGNIAAITSHNNHFSIGKQYTYDQLNRLLSYEEYGVNMGTKEWNSLAISGSNASVISYDGNGNILSLDRNDSALGKMDELGYEYYSGTDQLKRVFDNIPVPKFPNDIDNQPSSNYSYDAIGNLISDASEDIAEIRWTPNGKVDRVIRTVPTKERPNLYFDYGPMGNRLKKTVYFRNDNVDYLRSIYYIRDAGGNTMATYVERNCALEEFQDDKGFFYYQYSHPHVYYTDIAVGQKGVNNFIAYLDGGDFSKKSTLLSEVYEKFNTIPNVRASVFDILDPNRYFQVHNLAKKRVLTEDPSFYADYLHTSPYPLPNILNSWGESWMEAVKYHGKVLDFYSKMPVLFQNYSTGMEDVMAFYYMNRQMAAELSGNPQAFMDYLYLDPSQYYSIEPAFSDPSQLENILLFKLMDLYNLLNSSMIPVDEIVQINALLLMAEVEPWLIDHVFMQLPPNAPFVFENAIGWLDPFNSDMLNSILQHINIVHPGYFVGLYYSYSYNPMASINWSLDVDGLYLRHYFRRGLVAQSIIKIARKYFSDYSITVSNYNIYFQSAGVLKPIFKAALLREYNHPYVLQALINNPVTTKDILYDTESLVNLRAYMSQKEPFEMLKITYNHDHLETAFEGLTNYSPLEYMVELKDEFQVDFGSIPACAPDNRHLVPTSFEIYGSSRLGMADAKVKRKEKENLYSRTLKAKTYQLTDHLGSVVATVSDKKLHPQEHGGSGFQADVTGRYDRYPFGMEIMDRSGDFSLVDYTKDQYIKIYNGLPGDCGDYSTSAGNEDCTVNYNIYNQPFVSRYLTIEDIGKQPQFTINISARLSEIIPNLDADANYVITVTITNTEDKEITGFVGAAGNPERIANIPQVYDPRRSEINLVFEVTGSEIESLDLNGKLPIEILVRLHKGHLPETFVTNINITQIVENTNIPIAMRDESPYAYGYQSQLRDDEIYGSGNSYSAEYWQYDPRLGRRWNVDPIVKPWESSYATFSNNPIYFIDPSGLTAKKPGKRTLWERIFGKMSNGKKHGPKTGFRNFFDKLFEKIENMLGGNEENKPKRSPDHKTEGPIDYPPGWENGNVIGEVNIIGRKPLVPEGYYILTDPDSKNFMPVAEPWVTDPVIPNGNLDVGVMSNLTYYADRWRNIGLPSFEYSPWEYLSEIVGRLAAMWSEWYDVETKIKLEAPDEKSMKQQVEKTAADNHHYPKVDTLTEWYMDPEGNFDTSRHYEITITEEDTSIRNLLIK